MIYVVELDKNSEIENYYTIGKSKGNKLKGIPTHIRKRILGNGFAKKEDIEKFFDMRWPEHKDIDFNYKESAIKELYCFLVDKGIID